MDTDSDLSLLQGTATLPSSIAAASIRGGAASIRGGRARYIWIWGMQARTTATTQCNHSARKFLSWICSIWLLTKSKVTVDHGVQIHEDLVVGSEVEILAEQHISNTNKRCAANMEDGISNGNIRCSTETVVQPVPVISKRNMMFGSELPDESIGTSLFFDSSINCGASYCSDGISKASVSRSFSNFQFPTAELVWIT